MLSFTFTSSASPCWKWCHRHLFCLTYTPPSCWSPVSPALHSNLFTFCLSVVARVGFSVPVLIQVWIVVTSRQFFFVPPAFVILALDLPHLPSVYELCTAGTLTHHEPFVSRCWENVWCLNIWTSISFSSMPRRLHDNFQEDTWNRGSIYGNDLKVLLIIGGRKTKQHRRTKMSALTGDYRKHMSEYPNFLPEIF